ncbi:uncharacterized protein BDZ99DRAFT_216938 [Mytilinidion resinicola]|uniref:Uncharacterized protein n=1 Tax=Mytilinidion resinicola TaxID=574789 RepID=A0A6A6Y1R5_9PEZI|nr:uncharacterized protein BDZ99DRAFT_216938 [Mytilinidion resinicola]KAF2801747.1 hypothetical protein BDZ99DRAFT_216938 [Mytilinidion resinicola]
MSSSSLDAPARRPCQAREVSELLLRLFLSKSQSSHTTKLVLFLSGWSVYHFGTAVSAGAVLAPISIDSQPHPELRRTVAPDNMSTYNRTELPPRGTKRSCPNMRTCRPGLGVASFNPFVSNREAMLRRICMLGILLTRTANSVFITLSHGMGPSIIPSILLGILFFFFVAYSLHLIGEMTGSRKSAASSGASGISTLSSRLPS